MSPRIGLHARPEALALWRQAAAAAPDAESLSDWARSRLIIAAAEELGLDPVECLHEADGLL